MKVKKHLTLNQAEAGQSLADDICDVQGNCLMAAGVVLNTAMLKHLQERGIGILTVWGEQTLSEAEIAEQQVAVEARLAHRFRQLQDDPDMRRLHKVLLAYRMESFTEQEISDEFARACVDTRTDNGGDEGGG